jgi:hypothetical protein
MEEQENTTAGFEVFDTPEAMIEAEAPQQQEEQSFDQAPAPMEEPQGQEQPLQESAYVDPEAPSQPEFNDSQLDDMTLMYLSEKLGRQVTSFDEFNQVQEQQQVLDERVDAISRFVQETGRSPQDWFAYQSLDPQNMDDSTAVRVKLATDYPDLSSQEVNMLMKSKYGFDDTLATEEEINIAKLNLKIAAQEARQDIATIREEYLAPDVSQGQESFVNDDWINNMSQEVDALQALEFDVADGKTFQFSLDQSYLSELKDKQANLDSFFDRFVDNDGNWNHDELSSMFAVRDNIDRIVSSAYRQGMSDGQRNVVSTAANISTASPNTQGMQQQENPLGAQVKQILRGGSGFSFGNI